VDNLDVTEGATRKGIFTCRPAGAREIDELADLAQSIFGARSFSWRRRMLAACHDTDAALIVARSPEGLIGYGRVSRSAPRQPEDPGPDGFYLNGLAVVPSWRRHGVGTALTRYRIAWVRQRSSIAYAVVEGANVASLKLHVELGFTEILRSTKLRRRAETQHPRILLGLAFDRTG
jgi:GNAT superfamily N-acetyltransferase